jgi:hypothetical protein
MYPVTGEGYNFGYNLAHSALLIPPDYIQIYIHIVYPDT